MSPRRAPLLLRLLGHLLWFVVRLVVLGLTGKWLSGTPAEALRPDGAGESGAPSVQTAYGTEELDPPSQEALAAAVAPLRARAEAVEERCAHLSGAERLSAAVASVLEELQLLSSGHVPAHEAPSHLQRHLLEIRYLERAAEQRSDAALGAWLGALDRLAHDLNAPPVEAIAAHEPGAHERHWVSVEGRLGESVRQALSEGPVGALPVDSGLYDQPARWPGLASQVARALLTDTPDLLDELHTRHDLPVGVPLPHAHVGVGPEEVHGALGAWLETLFTDVYATLRLGPVYPEFLSQQLASPEQAERAHAATARGTWLSSTPPPALRVYACLEVLEVLGQYRERERLEEAWTAGHGPPDQFYFPTADGTYTALPGSYVLAQLAPLLGSLTTEPLDSLCELPMASLPDLEFGHGDDAVYRRLRDLLPREQGEPHAPYLVLAAAAMSVLADGADAGRVAPAARRLLGASKPIGLGGHLTPPRARGLRGGRGRPHRPSPRCCDRPGDSWRPSSWALCWGRGATRHGRDGVIRD